jgi:hypothetical protein
MINEIKSCDEDEVEYGIEENEEMKMRNVEWNEKVVKKKDYRKKFNVNYKKINKKVWGKKYIILRLR